MNYLYIWKRVANNKIQWRGLSWGIRLGGASYIDCWLSSMGRRNARHRQRWRRKRIIIKIFVSFKNSRAEISSIFVTWFSCSFWISRFIQYEIYLHVKRKFIRSFFCFFILMKWLLNSFGIVKSLQRISWNNEIIL